MRSLVPSVAKFGIFVLLAAPPFSTQSCAQTAKTSVAIIGLDHDHVWGLLKDIANEPQSDLVAIADPRPELVDKAKLQVPASVRFFSDYIKMRDEA
jgi:hypothetical protein